MAGGPPDAPTTARVPDHDLARQLRDAGAPPEVVARWTPGPGVEEDVEPPRLAILPENWATVRVWCASATQWRVAGMSGTPIGLDYAGVAVAAGALGVALDEDVLAGLRTMESEAVRLLAERAAAREP